MTSLAGQLNPGARPGATQILVALALINLAGYAVRNALLTVTVVDDLTARYAIDLAQVGFLQTLYMIPHAIATLPFGWAGDAYDRRRVVVFGLVLASIAGALGAIGTSYITLASSRAAVGLATAAIVPVANSIIGQLYDGPTKAARLSIFNLGLFLGGVVGFALGTALGFPLVVIALAIPGIALSLWLLRLPVPEHPYPPPSEPLWVYLGRFANKFGAEARVLIQIRTLRWIMFSATAMAFAGGGYTAWLSKFLVNEKGMSEDAATSLLVAALFGGLSGILVGGRLGDRLRSRLAAGRMWTVVLGMLATVPCAALAITVSGVVGLYVAGIATLFCFSIYHAPMAATVDDLAPPGRSVAAQGLVIGVMHLFGTAPSSWILGAVGDRWDLTIAMWVPTAMVVVAGICMAIGTTSFAADHARARAPQQSANRP